ncbi:hypothetical protein BJY52DRAFT_1228885 [Lactarius psammicola]|nr:hypothetical protein BJY52DRAFT_1228885 [Lactarius psammicola]
MFRNTSVISLSGPLGCPSCSRWDAFVTFMRGSGLGLSAKLSVVRNIADVIGALSYTELVLRNDSARDPEPLEEGQLEEEPFGDDQVWAVVLAQEEQRHAEVMRQRAEYHGMSPSTNSRDEEEVERMLQDTQARMERLSLELDERHLPGTKASKGLKRKGKSKMVSIRVLVRDKGRDWNLIGS